MNSSICRSVMFIGCKQRTVGMKMRRRQSGFNTYLSYLSSLKFYFSNMYKDDVVRIKMAKLSSKKEFL